MSIIVPHRVTIQGHSSVPHLSRVSCSCGYVALTSPDKANLCKAQHLSNEEPFPDLSFIDEGSPQ